MKYLKKFKLLESIDVFEDELMNTKGEFYRHAPKKKLENFSEDDEEEEEDISIETIFNYNKNNETIKIDTQQLRKYFFDKGINILKYELINIEGIFDYRMFISKNSTNNYSIQQGIIKEDFEKLPFIEYVQGNEYILIVSFKHYITVKEKLFFHTFENFSKDWDNEDEEEEEFYDMFTTYKDKFTIINFQHLMKFFKNYNITLTKNNFIIDGDDLHIFNKHLIFNESMINISTNLKSYDEVEECGLLSDRHFVISFYHPIKMLDHWWNI